MIKLKVASTGNRCAHTVIQSISAVGHNLMQEWPGPGPLCTYLNCGTYTATLESFFTGNEIGKLASWLPSPERKQAHGLTWTLSRNKF